jgi:hypothetical protein
MKGALLAFIVFLTCAGLLVAQDNSLYLPFDDESDLTACGTLADDADISVEEDEFDEGITEMAFAPTGNNFITIDLGEGINFNQFTIAFWFNRTDNTNRGMLVAMNDYNYGWNEESTGGMIMNLEDDFGYAEAIGKITMVLNDDTGEGEAYLYEDWCDLSGEDGNWHHLAITFNKENEEEVAGYLNGQVVETGWKELVGSGNVIWDKLTLGNVPGGNNSGDEEPPTSGSYGIVGLMDDFVIYDWVLSASEILDLYDNDGIPEEFEGCVETGVNSIIDPGQTLFLPNPAGDVIKLQSGGMYTLYNALGQLIRQHSTAEKGSVINVSDLDRGLYFLQGESTKGIRMAKVILQ